MATRKINNFHQGKMKILNEEKYKGKTDEIIFRSGLERRWMNFLDNCPLIEKWSSETVVVPYVNQVDGRIHRYFTDNWIRLGDGREFLIELKPNKYTKPPRKNSKRYLPESLEFIKNMSKWKYAEKYATKNGMLFRIITDKEVSTMFSDKKILENIRKILEF